MKPRRAELVGLGLVVASFVIVALLYDRLPESVPRHWNAQGIANGFTPKPWGAFLQPLVMAGVALLLFLVPRVSPRGYDIERFRPVYDIISLAILGFLFVVGVLVLLAGAGIDVPMVRAVYTAVGMLLIILGNFMGKLTKNFFVGIRTPWTLANDEVWFRTHRLGGKLFVVAGLGVAVSAIVGWGSLPVFAAVTLAAAIPVVYSYFLYRKLAR